MKLVKKNVVNQYGDSEVHWMIAEDIKHIVSGGWIVRVGSYGWKAFDGDGKWISSIGYVSKKSAMIEALYEHSEMIQNGIDDELRKEAEQAKNYALEKAYGEFKKLEVCMVNDENEYKVGDLIDVEMSNMSKASSVSDHFASLYSWAKVVKNKAKVINVIELSNDEYDSFIDDFYGSEGALKVNEMLVGGGCASDDKVFDGLEFMEILNNKDLLAKWRESSYELVNMVVSKGRKSIVVNPEGYKYVRYMGFAA